MLYKDLTTLNEVLLNQAIYLVKTVLNNVDAMSEIATYEESGFIVFEKMISIIYNINYILYMCNPHASCNELWISNTIVNIKAL